MKTSKSTRGGNKGTRRARKARGLAKKYLQVLPPPGDSEPFSVLRFDYDQTRGPAPRTALTYGMYEEPIL